jgi:methyltransferase (TIGR00027 family)
MAGGFCSERSRTPTRVKSGIASETAAIVCMGRAIAHGRTVADFSDPTAMALLSPEQQAEVERIRQGPPPKEWRARFRYEHLMRESQLMAARTVAIDMELRAAAVPQVVILGAGLDGRAWRMRELAKAVLFEVDHPDSQRQKLQRVTPLRLEAREVRFVPLDFTHGDLAQALEAAGHNPHLPTAWIWEGVVMYLTRAEIESTLSTIEARSAPGSRLIVVYHQPALMLLLLAVLVRRMGEPIRTVLTQHQMRKLLDRYGFRTRWDRDLPTIGSELSSEIGRATRLMRHLRIIAADRKIMTSPG